MAHRIKFPLSARIVAAQRYLQRTVDSFWAFVVSLFSKLRTPFKNANRSKEQRDDTSEKHRNRKAEPMTVPDVPPPPANTGNANQYKHESTPLWEKILAIIGVSAAVIYAGIAFFQWRTQIDTMQFDARAWFDVDFGLASDAKEGDILGSTVRIRNKGKTAGKKLLSEWVVSIYKSSETVPFDYSNSHEVTEQIIGVIYPDDANTFPITKPPGQAVKILTKDDVESLKKGTTYIAAYGRGLYFDVFNKPHWFHACNWKYYGTGGWYHAAGCTIYNETGDGKMPDSDVK